MKKPMYYNVEAIKFIHKKYSFVPIWVIRRILYANDLYMYSQGIIDFMPTLDMWSFPKKKLFK